MTDLTNKEQKQLDYLLADYSAVKSEIAHRSNLQRIVLAAYVALVALVGKEASGTALTSLHIVGLWLGSSVALSYYVRQGLEICRLAKIASERIAPTAGNIINVDLEQLLPSQTNPKYPEIDKVTARYNYQFKWLLFFVIPLGITLFYLGQDWAKLVKIVEIGTRAPYVAIIAVVCVIWTFCLLKKHVNKQNNDA